ncbi:unnamed protein product [Aphis gossypii]|uniref:Uncharacterized protein n=1 Tax=Aphis gossypii TaxID=80765 RepID=A0A9P0JCN9_APHGO|nr:unnamed protein product [Aphis gossypii]
MIIIIIITIIEYYLLSHYSLTLSRGGCYHPTTVCVVRSPVNKFPFPVAIPSADQHPPAVHPNIRRPGDTLSSSSIINNNNITLGGSTSVLITRFYQQFFPQNREFCPFGVVRGVSHQSRVCLPTTYLIIIIGIPAQVVGRLAFIPVHVRRIDKYNSMAMAVGPPSDISDVGGSSHYTGHHRRPVSSA